MMKQYSSFVLYKLPNKHELFINSSKARIVKCISDLGDSNFVISPFDTSSKWPVYAFDAKYTQTIDIKSIRNLNIDFDTLSIKTHHADQEEYQNNVKELTNEINKGEIKKVVLSRVKYFLRRQESLKQLFLRLCEKYPRAFVYLTQLPNGQLWCGASPETLAKFEDTILETMALAGTQSLNDRKLEDVIWAEKELDEQKWVQDHVRDMFKEKEIRFKESQTYTAPAGHLAHIRTDFAAMVQPDRASELLKGLHPTPAVCGTPTRASKKLILDIEKHDRIYYSGLIGLYAPLKFQLFVNLRCMRIDEVAYHLYVGGGITDESDPEMEYLETENKAEVLNSVILEISQRR